MVNIIDYFTGSPKELADTIVRNIDRLINIHSSRTGNQSLGNLINVIESLFGSYTQFTNINVESELHIQGFRESYKNIYEEVNRLRKDKKLTPPIILYSLAAEEAYKIYKASDKKLADALDLAKPKLIPLIERLENQL